MSKVDEIKKEMADLNEVQKAAVSKYQDRIEALLHEGLKALFEEFQQVKSVSFVAYTPYFNDGDTCDYWVGTDDLEFNEAETEVDEDEDEDVFYDVTANSNPTMSVKGPNPEFNPGAPENWSNQRETWITVPNPNYIEADGRAVQSFVDILKAVDDDVWMNVVGDHVKVTITKDGIETDDYSHD